LSEVKKMLMIHLRSNAIIHNFFYAHPGRKVNMEPNLERNTEQLT
jgi:hypothetical protein